MGFSSDVTGPHRALLYRLLWPVGLLFCATFAMLTFGVVWASHRADDLALDRERQDFAAAMEQRIQDLRRDLGTVLATAPTDALGASREPGLWEVVPQAFARLRGFDRILLVRPVGRRDGTDAAPRLETEEPGEAEILRGVMRTIAETGDDEAPPSLRTDTRRVPTLLSRIVSDGRLNLVVLAVPRNGVGGRLADEMSPRDYVLASSRLDDEELAHLAELHGLRGFAVASVLGNGGHEGFSLTDARGAAAAQFTWDSDRPGGAMLERVFPLLLAGLVGMLALFGAVAFYYHRTTRTLAEADAVSREFLKQDPLSGLPNRLPFNERLQSELRALPGSGRRLAVMFIDLDRFKDVNDAHGHSAGDELIQRVAKRLLSTASVHATVARLGSDEFGVVLPGIDTADEAVAASRLIIDTLMEPFKLAHGLAAIGASIGVALAPDHGQDPPALMRLADAALRRAKSEGRNRVVVFQPSMLEALVIRKVVEDDLRHAIQNDELILHYQPLFSADGETIVGVEALVRWPHPTRGLISPGEFIPIAEEGGLVIPLGEWVLRRACLDGLRWPGITVAVNVSPAQFRDRTFVSTVEAVMGETGFERARLELELTEGMLVEDAEGAVAAINDLRALGVRLALDDFGTGHSSLIYLRRFAFDKIKIDRSFLESLEVTGEAAILIHSIVHLGRALGLTVTAEGIETVEQHRFLQALGCHQLQGFLFARPVPASEIDRMLPTRRAPRRATAA